MAATNLIEIHVVDRTGALIAPLPDASLNSMNWVLNGAGAASFTISPRAAGATAIQGVRREIQIWFDSALVWWGVPWAINGNSQQITVTCEGLLSLFTKRFIDRMTLTYASIDQFSVGWDLLNYAQSEAVEADRNFNIVSAAFGASGVPRSREYPREEHKMILDCLKEFDGRDLLNGFDWDIIVDGSGQRAWTPYYPRKGSLKPNYGIEFKDGGQRNLSDFGYAQDYRNLATLAYVTGGTVTTGGSSFRKEGKYEDTNALTGSPYWDQMQSVVSDGTQLDQAWLDARAQQEVTTRHAPDTSFTIKSARTTDLDMFQNVFVGDTIPAYFDCGIIQYQGNRRIYEMTWNPDNTLDLVFGV